MAAHGKSCCSNIKFGGTYMVEKNEILEAAKKTINASIKYNTIRGYVGCTMAQLSRQKFDVFIMN